MQTPTEILAAGVREAIKVARDAIGPVYEALPIETLDMVERLIRLDLCRQVARGAWRDAGVHKVTDLADCRVHAHCDGAGVHVTVDFPTAARIACEHGAN